MKTIQFIYLRNTLLLGLVLMTNFSCERDISDEATLASLSNVGEIFTDTPVGMGSNFYFPYGGGPDNPIGSKPTAWSVDQEVSYKGTASMRFDVPDATDSEGNYAGGILRIDGAGRDLSGYDALTFWAKSLSGVTVAEIGFGEDFYPNKYITTIKNVSIGTQWKKYIIPIPDASKLINERGMFRYAANTTETNGKGYTFWIDELKFEKLGTIGQIRPFINNKIDGNASGFVGSDVAIPTIGVTSNLGNGQNIDVFTTANFFSFNSSNTNVAVADLGKVSLTANGSALITAKLAGIDALGSINITSIGLAPDPTLVAANVISIFSDKYTNKPVDYFNGYWQYSTTLGQSDIKVKENNIIKYTKLNFVGIEFQGSKTVNAATMTHFHIDIFVEDAIQTGDFIRVQLQDLGTDNVFGGGNDKSGSLTINATSNPALKNGGWISLDLPFSSFPGLSTRSNLAQIVLVTDGTTPTGPGKIENIFVDNIYFHN